MGYEKVKLKDVAELLRNGASIKQGNDVSGFPITRIETIADGSIDPLRMGYAGITDKKKYGKYFLRDGDILISHINSEKHLGKCAIYRDRNEEFIHGMNLLMFRPSKETIYPNFAYYFFKSPFFIRQLPKITKKSVNQASMSIKDLNELDIPLPPMDIQIKIANALDKAQELVDNRKAQIEKYDELLQSVFLDMFGDPVSNNLNWEEKKLGNISKMERGKFTPRPRNNPIYFNGKYPFIQTGDISKSNHRLSKYKQTLNEKGILVSKKINKGNIVIAIVGATIGATAILNLDVYATDSIVSIKPDSKMLNNIYLEYNLRFWREPLLKNAPEVARPNINLKILNDVKIILPPLSFQNQFSSIVGKVEIEKKKMEDNLVELKNNFNSIIQRAFRGELF